MNLNTVGIKSIGYYIPTDFLTKYDIAKKSNIPVEIFTEKIGFEKKAIANSDLHPSIMGQFAAMDAIDKAKIAPENIDIIAFCSASDSDYRFWSPAAKIQHLIGAKNSFAFEVKNFCNSGNLGLHICRNMLLADSSLSHALIICAEKLSPLVNYHDTNSISCFTWADGAVAAILKKGESSNQILSYSAITDGSMADEIKIPNGGTKIPFVEESYSKNNYIQIANRNKLEKILSEVYLDNYCKVIHNSLLKSGYSLKSLNWLFTNQVKKSLSEKILKANGLTTENTFISLLNYGHLGAADTLLCLAKTIEAKKLSSNSLVILASSGAGFSWGALTLKY